MSWSYRNKFARTTEADTTELETTDATSPAPEVPQAPGSGSLSGEPDPGQTPDPSAQDAASTGQSSEHAQAADGPLDTASAEESGQ